MPNYGDLDDRIPDNRIPDDRIPDYRIPDYLITPVAAPSAVPARCTRSKVTADS
jgi:hypothetical protein